MGYIPISWTSCWRQTSQCYLQESLVLEKALYVKLCWDLTSHISAYQPVRFWAPETCALWWMTSAARRAVKTLWVPCQKSQACFFLWMICMKPRVVSNNFYLFSCRTILRDSSVFLKWDCMTFLCMVSLSPSADGGQWGHRSGEKSLHRESVAMFTWTQIMGINAWSNKNALCQHIIERFWSDTTHSEKNFIQNERGGDVHTCTNCVSLVGLKLSLLHISAPCFQDGKAHSVFLSAFLWTVFLAIMAWTFASLPSRLSMLHAAHATQQHPFMVMRSRRLPLSHV